MKTVFIVIINAEFVQIDKTVRDLPYYPQWGVGCEEVNTGDSGE